MEEKIKQYWNNEVAHYNSSIWREIYSDKGDIWLSIIDKYIPKRDSVSVLDIGTGPGYLPIILSKRNYRIWGIDGAESMIAQARLNIKQTGGSNVHLSVMDAHNLEFPDQTFDLIICRRVIWTMHNPTSVYQECFRVLKPGGKLIVFDGNYYSYLFSEEIAKRRAEDHFRAQTRGIEKHNRNDQDSGDRLGEKLFLSSIKRPEWDVSSFIDIGFSQIIVAPNLIDNFDDEALRLLWGFAELFTVVAEK